ncbi:MAG: PfkB family carbohydrate kinase [Bacillota bacterium]
MSETGLCLPLVLAVTPNPSVDRVWRIPGFETGRICRVERVWLEAGGKGCNVARMADDLGAPVAATGFLAGSAGDFVERELARRGIVPAFHRLAAGETRTCPTIIDPVSGRVTEIREPGPPVGEGEVRAFAAHFDSLLGSGVIVPRSPGPSAPARPAVVALSGSLPPGAPPDLYARLIGLAAARRIPCVLDASGEPLRVGAEAGPWAVKINREELLELTRPGDGETPPGGEGKDEAALVAGLARLVAGGVTLAVVTRGVEGLLASDGRAVWRARPPAGLRVVQPVGSGDAATAALVVRLARWLASGRLDTGAWPDLGFAALPEEERAGLVRDMVAAGAANAVTEGLGTCPPDVFARFRREVEVEATAAG